MHEEILSAGQKRLLPLVMKFSSDFGLVGGTALALQLGYRRSKAKSLFGGEFNEKLFREQLSYFKDIDYSEDIEYMPGFETSDEETKKFLSDVSLQKD